jgi:hypothetical protein
LLQTNIIIMVETTNSCGICPSCQSPIDLLLAQCRCPAPTRPSAERVAQAETVFESYLAARVVRARRDVTAAKIALLRDPRNRTRLKALHHAQAEAEQLQAQLSEQTHKAVQARAPAGALEDLANTGQTQPANVRPERLQQDMRHCPRCGRQLPGSTGNCGCAQLLAHDATHLTASFLNEADLLALRQRK